MRQAIECNAIDNYTATSTNVCQCIKNFANLVREHKKHFDVLYSVEWRNPDTRPQQLVPLYLLTLWALARLEATEVMPWRQFVSLPSCSTPGTCPAAPWLADSCRYCSMTDPPRLCQITRLLSLASENNNNNNNNIIIILTLIIITIIIIIIIVFSLFRRLFKQYRINSFYSLKFFPHLIYHFTISFSAFGLRGSEMFTVLLASNDAHMVLSSSHCYGKVALVY